MMNALLMSEPGALSTLTTLPADALPSVDIYTDGACSGNPGPGGWGAVILYQGQESDLAGGEPLTTNNRMELRGAIEALKALPLICKVTLYTDSQYVKDGITLWISNWRKNGWKTADKKPVKNQDLWQELEALQNYHHVQWKWVQGHAGNPMNERADALARNAIVSQKMNLSLS